MHSATLIVMWYDNDRVWIAKDDRHMELSGQGVTPEAAISDLRLCLQDKMELDTPIWAWRGPFDESHI